MTVGEVLKARGDYIPLEQTRKANFAVGADAAQEKFSDTLSNFMGDVNDLQKESAKQSERFISGEAVDLHDVMIASEKAKTGFTLLMELRNKALDMYREVIRIQV